MIAVDHSAAAIHREHAVGIAVKGESHGSTTVEHGLTQRLQLGGTAGHIDALPIGLSVQHCQIGPKTGEDLSGHCRCRPPAKVQHDRDSIQSKVSNGRRQSIPVGHQQIVPLAAHSASCDGLMRQISTQSGLDLGLAGRLELAAVGTKNLDPIIGQVVTGRHHQPTGCTHLPDQQRYGRVGQRPRVQTSRPAAVSPAVRAATSMLPLLRESMPINTGPSC